VVCKRDWKSDVRYANSLDNNIEELLLDWVAIPTYRYYTMDPEENIFLIVVGVGGGRGGGEQEDDRFTIARVVVNSWYSAPTKASD
jgi:hypothetical protein